MLALSTLHRLPTYLGFLQKAADSGQVATSIRRLSQGLALPAAQVEEDLAELGFDEVPAVASLIRAIRHRLNWDNHQDAFLVGHGPLATALLEYEGFRQYGLRIVATFQNAPQEKALPLDKLVGLAQRMHIQLGIIAGPAEEAQEAADRLVEGGVKWILNLAPIAISVPDGVKVENENLAAGLAWLCRDLYPAGDN